MAGAYNPIEPSRITRVDVVHARREICFPSLKAQVKKVKMTSHQHSGKEAPPESEHSAIQPFELLSAVPIVATT